VPRLLTRHAPVVALAIAVAASAALLLALTADLTFFQDTWAFLMYRQGSDLDAFLEPHNEHIVLIPVAIQKLLLEVFGLGSALPEQVLMTAMLATTAILLFVYVRRRLGDWPAVFAAILLLFLGPAWQVLLWPFEMGFVGALMTGVAMLLMLDREDRLGDVLACVLLAIGLGFSTLAVSFAAAAAVDVLQRRRSRGLGRAYVFVLPLLLFGAWYLGWGSDAESHLSLRNALSAPRFLLEGLASSFDSALGLSMVDIRGIGDPTWGRPLLVAAIVLVGVAQWRRPGFSPRLWPVAAATASFWLLAGLNYIPGREAVASRYSYAGVVFLLLLAAELLRGARFGRRALWVGGAVAVLAAASNLVPLRDGRDELRHQTLLTRADLGAIEIASRTVDPSFGLMPDVAGTPSLIDITAANYLPLADEHGSPAFSPAELVTAPEPGRRQADIVLSRALPISTLTEIGVAPGLGEEDCVPAGGGVSEVTVGAGTTKIVVPPGDRAAFSLRRFATRAYPVKTEGAPGDSVTRLRIPADNAPQPWLMLVEAGQRVLVCG
jgi:hypothetical protein